jgi:hypothetical protein
LPSFDPDYQYVHSVAGFGIAPSFVLCGNDGTTPFLLSNPPKDDILFQNIVTTINGR